MKYTPQQIESALMELILANGNVHKACGRIEASDPQAPIPERTLREWRNTHADLYEKLEAERDERVARAFAEKAEHLAAGAAQAQEKLLASILERDDEELKDANIRSLASAVTSVATAMGINVDKSLLIRGRPTTIVEQRDISDLMRALEQRFPGVIKVNPTLTGKAKELAPAPKEKHGQGSPE